MPPYFSHQTETLRGVGTNWGLKSTLEMLIFLIYHFSGHKNCQNRKLKAIKSKEINTNSNNLCQKPVSNQRGFFMLFIE